MLKATKSIESLTSETRNLSAAVSLLRDGPAGDYGKFNADQVSLFYFWRIDGGTGRIQVCSAAPPASKVFFELNAITDGGLRAELQQRNINTKAMCASDGQNVRVRFDFDISGEDITAINVRRF
ncbi:MAG: hypothetical protein LC803_21650 [Acidobacteria bacterium]|nr:hypothetical protein [Acidobacteriota bacterium]